MLTACTQNISENRESTESIKTGKIISISELVGKNETEVEKLLGKPDKIEKVNPSGTKGECYKMSYQSEKFEITFINDKSDWITINKLSNFNFNESSVELLGLSPSSPSVSNDNVIRWEYISGITELSVFSGLNKKIDYIYIKARTK